MWPAAWLVVVLWLVGQEEVAVFVLQEEVVDGAEVLLHFVSVGVSVAPVDDLVEVVVLVDIVFVVEVGFSRDKDELDLDELVRVFEGVDVVRGDEDVLLEVLGRAPDIVTDDDCADICL